MAADAGMELKHGIEAGEKRLSIEDLPIETQEGIFKHVSHIVEMERFMLIAR